MRRSFKYFRIRKINHAGNQGQSQRGLLDGSLGTIGFESCHQPALEGYAPVPAACIAQKLIEIGCGNSAWLPYFRKEFGFDVYGIDYSEEGCEQAEKILERENVEGTIYCADAFSPGEDLFSEFDVVCSFGVIEHFEDTAGALEAFSKYLRKGGLLVTTIPNMCGINGWMHKVMNRDLYDIHVPIDKRQLLTAVNEAGLDSLNSDYYVCVSLNVQLNSIEKPVKHYKFKRFISRTGAFFNLIFWWLEEKMGTFPQSKLFSRGIFSIAEKTD
jgi:SAM-dependent methyltransferase